MARPLVVASIACGTSAFDDETSIMAHDWSQRFIAAACCKVNLAGQMRAFACCLAVIPALLLFSTASMALAQVNGPPLPRNPQGRNSALPVDPRFQRSSTGETSPRSTAIPSAGSNDPFSGEYQTLPTMELNLSEAGQREISPVSYRQIPGNSKSGIPAPPGSYDETAAGDSGSILNPLSSPAPASSMNAGPWAPASANAYLPEAAQPVWDADEPWSWHIVPEGLMYKSYIAGEKEPRMSTSWLFPTNGGQSYWDSVLGGRFGLLRYGTARGIDPEGWQWDVEGGAFLRMLPETERDVMATDYRIGTPITYREGPFQWKFGYYHISSHLGDEFILKNPTFVRRNYSRDCLVTGVGYFPVPELRTYFEVGYGFYLTDGAGPWEVQFGAEYNPPGPTGFRGAPFAACNVHLMEENDWGGSINILIGWQWRGDTSDHTFRAGFQFYNGADNQLSFLGNTTQLTGLGIRYDY